MHAQKLKILYSGTYVSSPESFLETMTSRTESHRLRPPSAKPSLDCCQLLGSCRSPFPHQAQVKGRWLCRCRARPSGSSFASVQALGRLRGLGLKLPRPTSLSPAPPGVDCRKPHGHPGPQHGPLRCALVGTSVLREEQGSGLSLPHPLSSTQEHAHI